MKRLVIIFLLILFGCEAPQKFESMERPIIVVAKSKKGDVVVRNKDGYITLHRDYSLAQSLWNTYNVGDTIK